MSSVVLDPLSFKHYVPRVNDEEDVEMSDDGNSIMSEQQKTIQTQTGLYEILLNDKHAIFSVQPENEDYMRRVSVIMSFLSLMEIAPVKACSLIKEASQDPKSQQFRDYILFKQIFTDMQRIREVKYALAIEKSRKHTVSSNQQSVLGSTTQLDNLQWMFSFFNMYSAPFHHKDTNTEDGDVVLYLRERSNSGLGKVAAVVLVQKPQVEQQKDLSQLVVSVLQELESNNSDSRTRLGVVINCNSVKLITIDADKTHEQQNASAKTVRSVSIAQRDFDMSDVTDFAELVTVLEQFLATSLNISSVTAQITSLKDDIIVAQQQSEADDMESSPRPKSYPSFNERDCFFINKFNTCLSYVYVPPHLAGIHSTSSTLDMHCVKKRSHFTNWEREVLSKLQNHPYVIKELEFDNLPLDFETTIMFENVRPLNKKMFSLYAIDNQGNAMTMTQQLVNTRFEILRQFIKQALHSVIYCHNNGVTHNNLLSRGGTFFLDEQYKLKLMGFEHATLTNNAQLRYRDMKHLAVVFAELMFNVQFDISGDDDDATNWSYVWEEIQSYIEKHDDIVEKCARVTANDKLLYVVNRKTKKHMFDLLTRMFHTSDEEYYHTFMYHSFIGMASSMYKEKSKQKLREKTVFVLHGSKNSPVATKKQPVDKRALTDKWTKLAGLTSNENM